MSKSRNYTRRDFEYEDPPTKEEIRNIRSRRKEKRLAAALKSRNLRMITQLEEEYE